MKTIIRITSLLLLTAMVSLTKAQTISLCAGASTVITAMNSAGLISPSYSMNPGGIASSNPTFTISPSTQVTYTLYVTGTNSVSAVQTTSNVITVQVNTGPVTIASPLTQTIGCGPGIVTTATCLAISPASNLTHNWYSPASTNPVPSSGSASTYPMTAFNGSVTTFTCVVVDNLSGCSTSKTVQVVSVAGAYPTFSLTSFSNFSLGCGTATVADINIVGANSMPPPGGGVVSYTMLPPGFVGTIYTTTVVITSYTMNAPGIYTMIVRDNGNLCESRIPITIGQNTVTPSVFASASLYTLSCNAPSVSLLGSSNTPNVTYAWKRNTLPTMITNSVLIVTTTPSGASVPSATVIDNYTLMVTSIGNLCTANTVVTVYQNTRPPVAGIALSFTALSCAITTINATNSSTTGVLPGTFAGNLGLNAILWEGPPPQAPATFTSTYLATTSGIYSMTVMDMNNGCSSTATANVGLGVQAAFTHTLTGSQAVFNNVSTGTGINSVYYWDFGDGITSNQQNPTHTYVNGGAHLVKFKVTNSTGLCADSIIQSLNISGVACWANSNFAMVPTGTAQIWNAIPVYPYNVAAASWSWGDGSVSNILYASHQYSAAAMYNICLSVTVTCVGTSTTCLSYNINRPKEESLIYQVNVEPPALSTGFTNASPEEQLSMTLVPNPNSGVFDMNLNTTTPVRLVIADLTGRIVYDQTNEPVSGALSIRVGTLPPGMYLVSAQSDQVKVTKRMVISQ